jgi:YgiT-type zinc finger domain-containing protein
MVTECTFCGNKHLKNTLTEYTFRHDGNYMIFHNVPALQCEFCGEKYFEAKVLKQIEDEFFAVQNGKKSTDKIVVPVEDFSTLNVA